MGRGAPRGAGRFAPSPSGPLHVGNLRTALLAWLFARAAGARFVLRVEDLDPVPRAAEHERAQLADLRALGLDWDGEVLRQSSRRAAHDAVVARLVAEGLTYPCFCTRREVQEATVAPHGAAARGRYPGTCASLPPGEVRRRLAAGRRPALRLRAAGVRVAVEDRLAGPVQAEVDDFVIRRNDGTPAYNLAVVVDDAHQGVGEVVRGDDLLPTTPRQVHLAGLLGLPVPSYAHVPLVLGPDGQRLAKRHGAVTLADLAARGIGPGELRRRLAVGLGLWEGDAEPSPEELRSRFDPDRLPRQPWVFATA